MRSGSLVTLAQVLLAPCIGFAQSVVDIVGLVEQDRIEAHIAALEGGRRTVEEFAAASAYVRAQLESFGYAVLSDPISFRENLIAELPGIVDPLPILIIGAHLDTFVAPGADDNASGVAGMLEAARVLRAGRYETSVQFISFAIEEVGMQGSEQVAEAYSAAGTTVSGMVSLEMIGYTCEAPCQVPFFDSLPCLDVGVEGVTTGDYIAAVVNNSSIGLLQGFLTAAQTYVPGLPTNSANVAGTGFCFPDSRRSDHSPFWDAGFPAMMITDTADFRNPFYHTALDRLDTLDLGFATQVTRAVVGFTATQTVFLPEPHMGLGVAAGSVLLYVLGTRRGRL